ncbi:Oncosphere antigen B [Taenia solium]|eukprot:TsM_001064500 transcript=TsM_001064500 gene=TsM_001064500
MKTEFGLRTLPSGVTVTKAEGTKESPLSHYFHWSQVDPQTYQLSWDTQSLAELGVDPFALTAVAADFSGIRIHKTAGFSQAAVTLENLHPDKLYTVRLEAFEEQVGVWS